MSNKLNKIVVGIFAGLMAFMILSYIANAVYRAKTEIVTTEQATYTTISDTVQVDSWVIRNEETIDYSSGGVLSYQIDDGGRVEKNGVIANVYNSESDATAQTRAAKLQTEIDSLKSLEASSDISSNTSDTIGNQITEVLASVVSDSNSGTFSAESSSRSRLQYLLSEKQIIMGNETNDDYSAKISSLESEMNSVLAGASSAVGTLTSPSAGYFVSSTDGYEDAFDLDNIEWTTVSQFESFSNIQPSSVEHSGKVCTDFKWYVLAEIEEADKVKITESSDLYVEFPSSGAEKIPATMVACNTDAASGKSVLVLECSYMNAELATLRHETAVITVGTYSGVLVSEKAIHFETVTTTETDENGNETEVEHKNVRGVYVKSGDMLTFVQVFTDTTINGYAVCKTELSDEEKSQLYTSKTIRLYDEVVIGGNNLYDGKIVS